MVFVFSSNILTSSW